MNASCHRHALIAFCGTTAVSALWNVLLGHLVLRFSVFMRFSCLHYKCFRFVSSHVTWPHIPSSDIKSSNPVFFCSLPVCMYHFPPCRLALVVCLLVAGRVGLVCQALPFSVGVLCVSVDRQDPGVWSGLLVFACLQGRRGSACLCVPVRGRVAGPVARSLPFRVLCAVLCFGAVTSQLGRCALCLRATRCEPTRTSSRQTLRPSCWMVSVVSLLRGTVANHPEAPPPASPSRAPALPPRSP